MGLHVIDFRVDGTVEAMHSDKFDLGFLGDQNIERASDIRFDSKTQKWGVWLQRNGHFSKPHNAWAGFSEYDTARKFEVEVLNICRERQVHPLSDDGIQIAISTRAIRQA